VIVFLVNCDYNVLLSWAFYYFFASLTTVLPWSHCENDYNTPQCTTGQLSGLGNITNVTNPAYNVSGANVVGSDPVTEFWE